MGAECQDERAVGAKAHRRKRVSVFQKEPGWSPGTKGGQAEGESGEAAEARWSGSSRVWEGLLYFSFTLCEAGATCILGKSGMF